MPKKKPEAFYTEDGGKWRVRVLSDALDGDGMRVVRLRCLEQVRPSPMFGEIKTGDVWSSSVRPGYELMVGWSLQAIGKEGGSDGSEG